MIISPTVTLESECSAPEEASGVTCVILLLLSDCKCTALVTPLLLTPVLLPTALLFCGGEITPLLRVREPEDFLDLPLVEVGLVTLVTAVLLFVVEIMSECMIGETSCSSLVSTCRRRECDLAFLGVECAC